MSKFGMGNCFPFIRKHQKGNKQVCIAILGLDNAGKTTTAKSIQGEPLDDIGPTIGFDNIQFSIGKFNIDLYDLGGGKNIRGIWKNYLSEIYGLIYVIDSSDAVRMEEARDTLQNLFSNPKVQGKPVLLLANKQDEVTALDEGEIVEILNLVNVVNANEIPCRVERCAAKIGVGKKMDRAIKSGLRWLLGYIEQNMAELERRVTSDMAAQKIEQDAELARRRERVAEIRRQRAAEQAAQGDTDPQPPPAPESGDPFKPLSLEELTRKEEERKAAKAAAAAAAAPPAASAAAPPTISQPVSDSPLESSSRMTEPEASSTSGSLRPATLGREDPLPPPVLAGSTVRGQFYSPRGLPPPPAAPPAEENNSDGFLRPLKPPAAGRLEPLEPSASSETGDAAVAKKKKKKKRRIGRKNRLAPDPNAEDEQGGEDETSGASMGSRTPSRPDLFITEQIYTLDELDEDDVERSMNNRLGPNGDSEIVAT